MWTWNVTRQMAMSSNRRYWRLGILKCLQKTSIIVDQYIYHLMITNIKDNQHFSVIVTVYEPKWQLCFTEYGLSLQSTLHNGITQKLEVTKKGKGNHLSCNSIILAGMTSTNAKIKTSKLNNFPHDYRLNWDDENKQNTKRLLKMEWNN